MAPSTRPPEAPLAAAAGCSDEEHTLYVALETDLVPGVEFTGVRTALTGTPRVVDQLAPVEDLEGSSVELAPLEVPRGLAATLRPYQLEGVAWLTAASERGDGVILADDMGLGKTLQAIAHLLLLKERGRLDLPALIVAPTSLVGNWRREIEKFAPSLKTAMWHGARRMRGRIELARQLRRSCFCSASGGL